MPERHLKEKMVYHAGGMTRHALLRELPELDILVPASRRKIFGRCHQHLSAYSSTSLVKILHGPPQLLLWSHISFWRFSL